MAQRESMSFGEFRERVQTEKVCLGISIPCAMVEWGSGASTASAKKLAPMRFAARTSVVQALPQAELGDQRNGDAPHRVC